MTEFEREVLALLKSINERLEEQNKLLQAIADKPSYSSKPQKPMLGNAYLSEDKNFLWFEPATVFGQDRKPDKEKSAGLKQAFIVYIQVLAGDKMQLLGMREITLEKKGKEDKTYTVKALRFNWGVDTMRVFSALTANPTIAEREYYIKGLSEVLKEQS